MEEAIIKRVMPHSLEAEQSVIGSMIMDREAVLVASEILTGEDFYQRQYGIVFEAMVELFNKDEPVDLVTLQNQLRAKDVPEEVSSMEFVRDILNQVPTSANVKYYANIIISVMQVRSPWRKYWSRQRKRCLIWYSGGMPEILCRFARWC